MFNKKDFMRTKFSSRENEVKVPSLAPFFGDAAPVWRVRGLTGAELARVGEAAETARNMQAIIAGLVSGEATEITEAVRCHLGLSDDVPQGLTRRLEMLILGSVEPEVDREVAVKIAEKYPIEFNMITGEIVRLTGLGSQPGKLPGSGATQTSEPPPATDIFGESPSTNSDQISSPEDA